MRRLFRRYSTAARAHALAPAAFVAALCALVSPAVAQGPTPLQVRGPAGTVPELRLDGTFGTPSHLQVAAGLQFPAGTYLRLALLGGLGQAWEDGEHRSISRLEGQGRFHLDPLREASLGLYGLGGVAVINDDLEGWDARLVLGAGVELPSTGRLTWAVEAAVAGGLRLSVALRGVRSGRR
jgi:hypothetical protein